MARPTVAPDWATNANFGAGARPWNGQPNKTQPSSGVIAEGFDPENPLFADMLNWAIWNHGEWIKFLESMMAAGVFGDGRDGSATLDGTSTVSWASKSGTVYTMTQDINMVDLTLGPNVALETHGYRIYGLGTLTVGTNSVINNDGADATTSSGVTGTTQGGGGGGAGGVNAGGSNGAATVGSMGGPGGFGGIAGAGAGSPGTNPALAGNLGNPGTSYAQWLGHVLGLSGGSPTITSLTGGTGGGGGGAGNGTGGTGGQGAGNIYISFPQISLANANNIRAQGGDGGNGTGTQAAGGGGGGGGWVRIITVFVTVATGTIDAATCAPGGAAGSGVGTITQAPQAGGNGVVEMTLLGNTAISGLGVAHEESGNISVNSGDTSKTASFAINFSAAPPTAGAYKFDFSIARTDGITAQPSIIISSLTTSDMTFTIIDEFQGVISWRAWV